MSSVPGTEEVSQVDSSLFGRACELSDRPCSLSLLAGQRRLWEAVKRRKAMCKRKSWMSKVCEKGVRGWWGTQGPPAAGRPRSLLLLPRGIISPILSHFV